MTNDTRPPVAPVEGHYAMLRNNSVCGPLEKSCLEGYFSCKVGYEVDEWKPDGTGHGLRPEYDIIATISPEAMALAANKTLQDAAILGCGRCAPASRAR